MQYLVLRSRRIRVFGGVDLLTDAGWAGLKGSIAGLARTRFTPPGRPARRPRAH